MKPQMHAYRDRAVLMHYTNVCPVQKYLDKNSRKRPLRRDEIPRRYHKEQIWDPPRGLRVASCCSGFGLADVRLIQKLHKTQVLLLGIDCI
jgi:hypothetical protein